jgi:hypothetical protein
LTRRPCECPSSIPIRSPLLGQSHSVPACVEDEPSRRPIESMKIKYIESTFRPALPIPKLPRRFAPRRRRHGLVLKQCEAAGNSESGSRNREPPNPATKSIPLAPCQCPVNHHCCMAECIP